MLARRLVKFWLLLFVSDLTVLFLRRVKQFTRILLKRRVQFLLQSAPNCLRTRILAKSVYKLDFALGEIHIFHAALHVDSVAEEGRRWGLARLLVFQGSRLQCCLGCFLLFQLLAFFASLGFLLLLFLFLLVRFFFRELLLLSLQLCIDLLRALLENLLLLFEDKFFNFLATALLERCVHGISIEGLAWGEFLSFRSLAMSELALVSLRDLQKLVICHFERVCNGTGQPVNHLVLFFVSAVIWRHSWGFRCCNRCTYKSYRINVPRCWARDISHFCLKCG